MTKPTYCPHCWTELTVDDTTCYQCGEKVEKAIVESTPSSKNDWAKESLNSRPLIYSEKDRKGFREWHDPQPKQETPFITKLIWLFCFAVIGGVVTAWTKGELVL